MGVFDPHGDSPERILREGETISLKVERLTESTARVSWNIPTPADGCNSSNQAYNGMVVVLNTVANKPTDRPVNGIRYTADPTGNADLHAGDRVGDALIVGAFYNDKTTNSFTITDLVDGAAYFITGHAVDAQNRYHGNGASGYSLPLTLNEKQPDTQAFHEITLSASGADIIGSDATELVVGEIYNFFIVIDGAKHEILIDGGVAQTYDELVAEIDRQLQQIGGPFTGPLAPNTGGYFYNSTTNQLFQWDGTQNVELPVINHPTDPSAVAAGDFWLDSDSGLNELNLRDATNTTWNIQTPQIETGYDVTNPPCDAYWYNDGPCLMWKWNGSTWCSKSPVFVQETDPSIPPLLSCGTYWLDQDGQLFVWSTVNGCSQWVQVEAISWDQAPTLIVNGTYWFNDSTNELNLRIGGAWVVQTDVFVQDEQPITNIVGAQWYVPTTGQLFVLNNQDIWEEQPVLIFGTDPTSVESCDLWFNTANDQLYTWDAVNGEWDLVAQFFDQEADPSEASVLDVGAIWVDSVNETYYEWDGGQFVLISQDTLVVWPSDPTQIPIDTIWLQTTSGAYFLWDGTMWNIIDQIVAPNDPALPQPGDFWFNTSTQILNQWNGVAWIPVAYSSTPLAPAVGDVWYSTVDQTLLTWNGSEWVQADRQVTIALNQSEPAANICEPDSNIVFTRTAAGSERSVRIGQQTATAFATNFPTVQYQFEGTLFNSLGATASLKPPVLGGDGLEATPMYEQLGVGTDGTPDERRELADSIRRQLGYPTIEIELDTRQLDEAIQSAIEELRLRSSSAVRRVYFMMDLQPGKQRYVMTSKATGFNTIVSIMGIWRVTSAFQSTAYASGVYGQTVLQHLYHMGTFDLVSYHLISQYIEELEQLFATRVTYTFDEARRQLDIFQSVTRQERVLLDAVVERTEQELLTNRYTKNWIERWALAQAQLTLASIRGKFATLPGAGGGVSLNAADLENLARENIQWCLDDIDNFVVNDIENLGIGSELIIG
jgi:hypothetical protein